MNATKLFNKDFTLVIIGQIISLFGNAILRFALPLYLLRETGSAAIFGLVSATSFIPIIFLSFLGGILADRVNKRNIMVCLDFLTALIVLALTFLIGEVSIVPLFIVVLMLLYGISGAYQPAVQASIPALVPKESILSAGGIVSQINALAGLLGPIIGGFLFGSYGIMPLLVISIICFIVSAIMELFITIPFEKRSNDLGALTIIKQDIRESVHYMKYEKPLILRMIVIISVFNLVLSSMLIVGTPILIINILEMKDELLGVFQGVMAMGGLFGGILTAFIGKKLKLENSYLIILLMSLSVGIMALPFLLQMSNMICYIVLSVMIFIIMTLSTIFVIQMMGTIQIETPPELVGKIIALMMALSMSAQPIGQAIYGILFEVFAHKSGFIILCAAFMGIVIATLSKKWFKITSSKSPR